MSDEAGDEHTQVPGKVEEDAEVWTSPRKGGAGWTTPQGRPVEPKGGKTVPESDENTDITVGRRPSGAGPTGGRTAGAAGNGHTAGAANGSHSAPAASRQTPLIGDAAANTPRRAPASDADTIVYTKPRAETGHGQGPGPRAQNARVLLVGSGAREHAMALALRRSGAEVFAVIKHRNPGLVKTANGFRILDDRDVKGIVDWATAQKVEFAVIGPESPLEAGVTDALETAGIPVAAPSKAAARVETDKAFMRGLMARHDVPGRLAHHPFTDRDQACAFLDQHGPVWAVKPIGLTGGKGVQVYGDHFHDVAGAKAYVREVLEGRAAGGSIQFEELAKGEEFTVMAFTDGTTVLPMVAVQDHKRLRDGDQGPNTGGMGSYTQADGLLPFLTKSDYAEAVRIVTGIVHALKADGHPYKGPIYGQFMLTSSGPKVIEVNARFGDPEAVNVLHLLDTNYLEICRAMATGKLAGASIRFRPRATVVKYIVPAGYGEGRPASGQYVEVDEFNIKRAGAAAYYANIDRLPTGTLATMTSRAIAILGEGDTVAEANQVCENGLKHVHGQALFVRHDIGTPALLEKRVENMRRVRAQVA